MALNIPKSNNKNRALSNLDKQILSHLQIDGRMSISMLAEQLGRARNTIAERIERLQDDGVLKHFTVNLDQEKLGFGISAFVKLEAASVNHREIVAAVCGVKAVSECHVLAGDELLLIRIHAKDLSELRAVVDQLTQFGSTSTDIIFATVKSQLDLGV